MKILDAKDVCGMLKISRRTLYRHIKDEGFPYFQMRRYCKLTFSEDDIINWLSKKNQNIRLISKK